DGIRDRNVTGVQTCALPISGTRCSSLQRVNGMMRWCPVVTRTPTVGCSPHRTIGTARSSQQTFPGAVSRHAAHLAAHPFHPSLSERRFGKLATTTAATDPGGED